MSATVLPAAIPAELTALLAKQPLAKLVSLMSEIGGCDQSPTGRALEGALSYAIDTKVDEETTEDAVYALLTECRAAQGITPSNAVLLTSDEFQFAQHNARALEHAGYGGYTLDANGLPVTMSGLELLAEFAMVPIPTSPDDGGATFRRQLRAIQKSTVTKINLAIKEGRNLAKDY